MSNAELFAEIGRLNVLLHERDKEIEQLKGLMPPDERGPGFVGQGSWSVFAEKVVEERDALREELAERDREIEWLRRERTVLVAWLRKMTTMGSPITQVYLDQMLESLANWELAVPWREYTDQFGRTLPLEGHHKDCGYGKDGWSLCTCDELSSKTEKGTPETDWRKELKRNDKVIFEKKFEGVIVGRSYGLERQNPGAVIYDTLVYDGIRETYQFIFHDEILEKKETK